MLAAGVVEHAPSQVFLSHPFMVLICNSPKAWLVMDFSTLNQFVTARKFKMAMITQVRLHHRPNSRLVTLDLESAYWHVPIHPCFHMSLAFQAKNRTMQFMVLPFRFDMAQGYLSNSQRRGDDSDMPGG